jgi:hypothetical protein
VPLYFIFLFPYQLCKEIYNPLTDKHERKNMTNIKLFKKIFMTTALMITATNCYSSTNPIAGLDAATVVEYRRMQEKYPGASTVRQTLTFDEKQDKENLINNLKGANVVIGILHQTAVAKYNGARCVLDNPLASTEEKRNAQLIFDGATAKLQQNAEVFHLHDQKIRELDPNGPQEPAILYTGDESFWTYYN